MIDFHSHFLPNVDDGAKDSNISLEYMEKFYNLGFNKFLLSSHIYPNLYENTPKDLLERFNKFQSMVKTYFKDKIEIFPGSEVYLSQDTVENICTGKVLTINNKKTHVLFEVDFTFLPPNLDDLIKEISKSKLSLIWAHPERNSEIIREPEKLGRFIDQDVLVQINLGSLGGQFGEEIEETAKKLLSKDMVHFIGSDCHCSPRRQFVFKEAMDIFDKYVNPHYKEDILINNAMRIFEGQLLYPFPYKVKEKGLWNKFKKFFKI
ncbi:hypothetical protein J7L48_07530 [bacterium]|nr:hypothetical protein [bacterium]